MMVRRLLTAVAIAGICLGLSTLTARADSTGTDPQGKFQSPVGSGTPGVGQNFEVTFGVTDASTGCTATGSGDTLVEDCIAKNLSGNDWSSVSYSSMTFVDCSTVTVAASDLFEHESCSNAGGGTTLNWWGLNLSAADTDFLNDMDNLSTHCFALHGGGDSACSVANLEVQNDDLDANANAQFDNVCLPGAGIGDGSMPGVFNGCDFEFQLSPGPDGGDWAPDMMGTVSGPEPSTFALATFGIAGLGWFRRKKFVRP